jgi:hypothetical protein
MGFYSKPAAFLRPRKRCWSSTSHTQGSRDRVAADEIKEADEDSRREATAPPSRVELVMLVVNEQAGDGLEDEVADRRDDGHNHRQR